MNNNTTIIIDNDALESIENDEHFGANLANAIRSNAHTGKQVNIQAGCHIRAATVIEQHREDEVMVVAVGFNHGSVLSDTLSLIEHDSDEARLMIIRDIAFKFGFHLRRRTDDE